MLTDRERKDRVAFLTLAVGAGWRKPVQEETICLTDAWWGAVPWHWTATDEVGEILDLTEGRFDDLTHFAVSTMRTPPLFEEGSDGEYHRVESRIGTVLGFLADDVGVKAKASGLRPTARVATREHNEQHWYRFADTVEPVAWRVLAAAWKAAGLTDEEGQNPVRLGRLPGSAPPEKERARLLEITGLRWTWLQMMAAAGVDEQEARKTLAEAIESGGKDVGLHGAAADLAKVDRTFGLLWSRGMVIRRRGVGPWWLVTCPFGHEHSDGNANEGARYKPTGERVGGFICSRGGGHVSWKRFAEWADGETDALPKGLSGVRFRY